MDRFIRVSFRSTALALVFFVACDDPEAPAPTASPDAEFHGVYESGVLEFDLQSQSGHLSLVASRVEFDAASELLHAWVSIRNNGRENVPGPSHVVVQDLVPSSVQPANAVCDNRPTPSPLPGPILRVCEFDHQDTYGDDGVLSPGETSEAVEWIFAGTSGESFAFRALIVLGEPRVDGVISGVVFDDRNANGVRDDNEPGIPNVGIGLQDPNADFIAVTKTNERGRYAFDVRGPGLYSLHKTTPEGWRPSTPTELQVLIVELQDGTLSRFERADFGCVRHQDAFDIHGTVFLDRNRDGIRDVNEPGVASVGITVTSLACDEGGVFTARSASDGRYVILAQQVGCGFPWLVRRIPESGLVGTTGAEIYVHPRDPLRPEPSTLTFDFGMAPPDSSKAQVTIEGRVFIDFDADGEYGPDDRVLRGAQVQLMSPCDLLRVSHTDAAGVYRFEPFKIGFCPVTGVWQSYPEFRIHTTPNPVELQIPDAPGLHLIRVDFGIGPQRDGP